METEKLYTRKEVLALLKRQIRASATSVGRMEANKDLMFGQFSRAYGEDIIRVRKRLVRVNVIKF